MGLPSVPLGDFCHDSAKHASMMALAAPKVFLCFSVFFVGIKKGLPLQAVLVMLKISLTNNRL